MSVRGNVENYSEKYKYLDQCDKCINIKNFILRRYDRSKQSVRSVYRNFF